MLHSLPSRAPPPRHLHDTCTRIGVVLNIRCRLNAPCLSFLAMRAWHVAERINRPFHAGAGVVPGGVMLGWPGWAAHVQGAGSAASTPRLFAQQAAQQAGPSAGPQQPVTAQQAAMQHQQQQQQRGQPPPPPASPAGGGGAGGEAVVAAMTPAMAATDIPAAAHQASQGMATTTQMRAEAEYGVAPAPPASSGTPQPRPPPGSGST